jgi:hypothetical protein
MAGLIPLGTIADHLKDPLPTTGPHLDPRVIPRFGPRAGKRVNPEEAKSLLQNVLVGPNQTPLVQQTKSGWQWNFPITSKYGPRTAPTKDASSFHEGIDIGISAGTPLAYKGYGSFQPEKGYGVLKTTDAQGNPYDIQFLHTTPAKTAEVKAGPMLGSSTQETDPSRTADILKAFIYGTQAAKEEKPQKTFRDAIMEELLSSAVSQALNPTSFLSEYPTTNPLLAGQRAATSDFFGGIFG